MAAEREVVPYLCEECWGPIRTVKEVVRRGFMDRKSKKMFYRFWHAEHAPARLQKGSKP